jgi:hypothetical protein
VHQRLLRAEHPDLTAGGLAARSLADLFRSLRDRGEAPDRARGFVLRSAAGMLAEAAGLGAPQGNDDPIDPTPAERSLLARAASEDWSEVHPFFLGALLQATSDEGERHARGLYYTPEAAILEHVVRPTLLDPFAARIRRATTVEDLLEARAALASVEILDPACATGNFLYVAYRELERLERLLLAKIRERAPPGARLPMGPGVTIRAGQLSGIDVDPLAVELARITLAIAGSRARQRDEAIGVELGAPEEGSEADIRCDDALFCAWPAVDVIIGNPPFLPKNKMQGELGPSFVRRLRERYPGVPGRADYCVYWFRRAHDELSPGGRAGLVGTNTIRQNYSREGGLDYIVEHGGTITEAVSSMVWPGDAVVHVSIVNWIKGREDGPKTLSWQRGDARDSPWEKATLERIPSSLSASFDVTSASLLRANAGSGTCFQGQTHGHEGFVLTPDEARAMLSASQENADVVFPYLIGEELLAEPGGRPARWAIDFHPRDEIEARRYTEPFQRILGMVLPARRDAAARERARNAALHGAGPGQRGNHHHESFLRRFWLHSYPRPELIAKLSGLSRYVACCQVTKRPIFAFVSARIRPNASLVVFPLEDDYSFGVLQSALHAAWFVARCSTLKGDARYTSSSVFDTFPWPQAPDAEQVTAVAKAAAAVRAARRDLAARHGLSLRPLYASMESSGQPSLEAAHTALDAAVRVAYGMGPDDHPLAFLLALNRACAHREAEGQGIVGPGVPPGLAASPFVSEDCVEPPGL